MIRAIGLFLANCILTAVFYPFFINILYKFSLREKIRPDGPKTHLIKQGTPTMGGLAFILSVGILTILFNRSSFYGYFLGIITLFAGALGFLEDLHKVVYKQSARQSFKRVFVRSKIYSAITLPWRLFTEFWRVVGSDTEIGLQTYQKFILQSVISILCSAILYMVFGYNTLWLPLIGHVHLGIAYPFFSYFIFIAVLNSVNFTDGLDGLAGGLGFIAFVFYWIIASAVGNYPVSLYLAAFLGALLPFLYFNTFPARIFMGNVGSFAIGAALTVSAFVLHREISLLFICGVFLIDGVSSVIQQLSVKITGKRIFLMAPIHHHFELMGWEESKVVYRFYLISTFLGFVGLIISIV
jgi:phospho-N-acetylmuramoyl-pentapeptide-transferase